MITISNKKPTDRILELGAGDSPNPSSDVIVDVRASAFTHFTADFIQPLPIKDEDFTCVLAHFVLEHLPYRCVLPFLKEVHRVLKPGGYAIFAVPNTKEQIRWIADHQGGWDGKPLFEAASELLYGSQNMPGSDGVDHNTHRVYFDPTTAALLFAEAGFVDVVVAPYGERDTDLTVQLRKREITPSEMLRMSMEGKLHTKPVDDPIPDKLPPSFAPGSLGMPEIEPTQFRSKERELQTITAAEVGEADWGKLLSQAKPTQTPQTTNSPESPKTEPAAMEVSYMQPPASTPDRPAETVYGKNSGGRVRLTAEEMLQNIQQITFTDEAEKQIFATEFKQKHERLSREAAEKGRIVLYETVVGGTGAIPVYVSPEGGEVPMPPKNIQERPYHGLTVAEAFDAVTFAGKTAPEVMQTQQGRERVFSKDYFNGGKEYGGYAREGYRDFPVHEITARHVLARKPEGVLELGAARGYVLKRVQDAGLRGIGLEVSRHCYLTRVCEGIYTGDLCERPWVSEVRHVIPTGRKIDLCYSIATLEHIPEQHLPNLIQQMAENCKRGLHGVDFGGHDDGFDKTHVTLKDKAWWIEQFAKHAPGWPVEIVDKEELERGEFPPEVLKGDGKIKLNLGSFTTMFHHGWTNVDIHDLGQWAAGNGYTYQRHDIRGGLPYPTAGVDLIFSSHMLEHLTYEEGKRVLSECRRVLKPSGAMRILVPDAGYLMTCYQHTQGERLGDARDAVNLNYFDEINDQSAATPTAAGKLWALLHEGHASCYDAETLLKALEETGFVAKVSKFRQAGYPPVQQINREVTEMTFGLSLIVDAIPTM